MKAFGCLSLVALVSQAAAGVIGARDDSVALHEDSIALSEVHFSEEALLAQVANRTAIACNSPDDCPEEENALEKRRQSPFGACASVSGHYLSARCVTAAQMEVTCRLPSGATDTVRVNCNVPQEVCIENNESPSYAICQDVSSIVKWITNKEGGNTENTRYYHSSNKGQRSKAINNYYDINRNPISVGDTYFYTEPGKVFNNWITGASVAATRGLINWLEVQNVRTDVTTNGFGGLTVYSFVMT